LEFLPASAILFILQSVEFCSVLPRLYFCER